MKCEPNHSAFRRHGRNFVYCVALVFWLPAFNTSAFAAGETKDAAAAIDPILAWAPADTQALAYVGDMNSLMAEPLAQMVLSAAGEPLQAAHASWQETFEGPVLVAVRGSGFSLMSLGVTFATRDAGGDVPLADRIEERLVPSLAKLLPDRAELAIDRDGDMITITPFGLPMPPMTIYLAAREGVVLGDTSRSRVFDFLNGDAPPAGILMSADLERFEDIERIRTGEIQQLGYLNVRPLIAMARGPLDSFIPGLFDGLGLGSLEFVAFHTRPDNGLLRERTLIGVTDTDALPAQLLATRNGDLDLLDSLPADWPATWCRSWESAEWIVDIAEQTAGSIDKDIVDEFRAELIEFTREIGFDPQRAFLGNLVGQIGGGFYLERADDTQSVEPRIAVVFELRDPHLLHYQLQNLIDAYGLEVRTLTHHGVAITSRADGNRPHLTYAIVDRQWIVSNRESSIMAILDARKQQRTNAHNAETQQLISRLAQPAAARIIFHPKHLIQFLLPQIDDAIQATGDERQSELTQLREFLAALQSPMATSVAVSPGLVTIERVMDVSLPSLPAQIAITVLPSVVRSRDLSRRLVSAANIRGIATACHIYANDQEQKAFPESLHQLIELGHISLKQLASPYDGRGPESIDEIESKSAYLYLPGVAPSAEGDLSAMVFVAERSIRSGGANFGFVDGHVEWISEPEASRLLAELEESIHRSRR